MIEHTKEKKWKFRGAMAGPFHHHRNGSIDTTDCSIATRYEPKCGRPLWCLHLDLRWGRIYPAERRTDGKIHAARNREESARNNQKSTGWMSCPLPFMEDSLMPPSHTIGLNGCRPMDRLPTPHRFSLIS